MNPILTRPATVEDLDTLLHFEQGIVAAERPFDPTLKAGEIHYYDLKALILAPESEVIVATSGSEIVGSGYAQIRLAKDYNAHKRFAYLGFMYVKPEFRGRGVNGLVLEALTHWIKGQGIAEIRLEVYAENEAAKKAYEKAGFTPNLLEMRMNLE
ncbi:MAG: GNAT family N-acetyltransferase [Haliscomenobacter sp.]|uniref:GNAT family N-acetyltransferase n=1 Tax=Haliscomenobacter sp. TaxID=2717303 RepID=UPI0029B6E273|nr:GNAT family N-acetyltransferase [Haliscomenobacter sp.]MDX2070849.1 GNAT family N-acetyltransferase [Haliscomenobacter sp.]